MRIPFWGVSLARFTGCLTMRFLLLSFLYVTTLFAIIDIATVDFGDKTEGFSGALYGSFQKKRGNTEKDEAEYGGRIQYDTNKTITWLQGEAEKDKAKDYVTDDNAFIHLRHIHQVYNPAWAMEAYVQLKKDRFKNIQQRTLFGLGPRYRLLNSKRYGKSFMGISILDEKVDYSENLFDPNEHNTRISTYLSYKIPVNSRFELSYLGYYQPKLDNGSDYMTSSKAEMTIHLSKVFDLSYLIELDYDSQPARGVNTTDTNQRLSFIYRFGQNDPLSVYAQNLLRSSSELEDVNTSKVMAVKVDTKAQDIKDSTDTLAGEWIFEDERFSLLLDGEGSYVYAEGIYHEKLKWTLVSTDTQDDTRTAKEQSTKLVIIRFVDEEDRPGRVENYLWSEDSLVGLSGNSIRLFRR